MVLAVPGPSGLGKVGCCGALVLPLWGQEQAGVSIARLVKVVCRQ